MTRRITPNPAARLTLRRFAALAKEHQLIAPEDRIVVAVSGGPDSVAMLRLLADLAPSWNLRMTACHINHGLRGRESDEDADFAATLCRRWNVPMHLESASRPVSSKDRGGRSLQEWAREVRYAVLERVADELHATTIALGHTADDQAETVLMWMLRGAGLTGLAGIPLRRERRVIRPLLSFRRHDLIEFLEWRGAGYRIDSSNRSKAYLRNRIRHELLPILQQLNPAVVEVLCRQADLLRVDDQWLEEQAAEWLRRLDSPEGDHIDIGERDFSGLPLALQRRVVRRLLRRFSDNGRWPTFRTVSGVLDLVARGRTGATLLVPGAAATREYGVTRFARRPPGGAPRTGEPTPSLVPAEGVAVPIPSALTWPLTDQTISVRWEQSAPNVSLMTAGRCAAFDADRFTPELRVRAWRPGDVFHPAGMAGHRKKLQDYFSDLKVPRERRHRIPLLVAPEGVLWIVGHRTDQRFRATGKTTRALVAEVGPPTP